MEDTYKKMKLDIAEKWKIIKNEFYDIDIEDPGIPEFDKFLYVYDVETMVHLIYEDYLIDLGFYNHMEDGAAYCIHFIKGDFGKGILLELFCSNDALEIAEKINQIIKDFDEGTFELSKGLKFGSGNEIDQLRSFSALNYTGG